MLRVMRAGVSPVRCAKLPGGFARYSGHDHIVKKERVTSSSSDHIRPDAVRQSDC
jgi:hypothetical protein